MDIIRCFALLFVVSVHFFLRSGFYEYGITGINMCIMTFMRSFFIICVPLFLILSGYLMNKKKIDKAYYTKIIYTIGIYLLASLVCVLYKIFVFGETYTLRTFISGFLSFKHANYSWYVEMYIGLFLICPFLNVLYNNLKNRKEKTLLVVLMVIVTSLPHITNIFIPSLTWFANPTSSADYYKVLPTFWLTMYPITYYFIGCYLKEYKIKLSSKILALLSVVVFLLVGAFNLWRSYKAWYVWGGWQDYGSVFVMVQAVLFFAFFDNLKFKKFPKFLSGALKKISGLCFGGYLVSWVFDMTFYPILDKIEPSVPLKLYWFPVIVPCVFICSLILSYIINLIYSGISKSCKLIKK